jgi:hypothetical protein
MTFLIYDLRFTIGLAEPAPHSIAQCGLRINAKAVLPDWHQTRGRKGRRDKWQNLPVTSRVVPPGPTSSFFWEDAGRAK